MKKENTITIYCDESNHLLHNKNNYMTLGFISTPKSKTKTLNYKIRELKKKHGLSPFYEIKWTKVSNGQIEFYKSLVDFFISEESLSFRAIVADKDKLNHDAYGQTHDDWYYKMYYLLLGKTLENNSVYNVYIDIKDTCSSQKLTKLKDVLGRSYYDYSNQMFANVQHVHSHQINLLQLADLFIGAISYKNKGYNTSPAKLALIDYIVEKTGVSLTMSTNRDVCKFNILVWRPR